MRGANGDASRPGAGLGLALLATALLAGRLAEGDLIGDPVIYAAVAKSMLVRGEWGTQYLAGQPFFDKPPLVVWLAALAFKLFGVSTWSARLPGVALGIAACLVLWRLGAFLFDERVGLAAGAILALTPGFVRFGSTLLLDTALALGSSPRRAPSRAEETASGGRGSGSASPSSARARSRSGRPRCSPRTGWRRPATAGRRSAPWWSPGSPSSPSCCPGMSTRRGSGAGASCTAISPT